MLEAYSTLTEGCLVDPPERFVDQRGFIQNLVEGTSGVAFIFTLRGERRSAHYHKTDAHLLYVIVGTMYYLERAVGSTERPEPLEVKRGDMLYTPPMREHLCIFPTDTELVSISKLPRNHEAHEQDVVRVTF